MLGCQEKAAPPEPVGAKRVAIAGERWTTATPGSPAASEATPLALALVPAARNGHPAVAALVSYHLPATFRARYGEAALSHLRIVAVERSAHRVFSAPVVAPPEGAQAAAPVHFDDQAEGPAAGEPIVGSIGLDLGRVLNLPTEGLSYSVFLWIDELTSAPKGVHVDRSDARKGLMPMPVSGAVALSARPDASVAANEQPAVSLRTTAGSWKLEGELIPDKTHPLDPLLVLVEAPRRGGALAYGSTPLGKIDAPVYSFYFDPRNLFTPAQITEGPLFAFAMYGHVRTAVVRVDAPQPGGDGETHAAGDAAPPAPASSSP